MDISVMPTEMKVYFCIACFFTLVFLVKMIALFSGGDMDFDFDGGIDDHIDSGDAFQVFTVQSAIAFGMVFGWATLASRAEYGFSTYVSIGIGFVVGTLGALLNAYLMQMTTKLNSTPDTQYVPEVGTKAKVYLKVPANEKGFGLIQLKHKETNYQIKVKNKGNQDIPSHTHVKVVANSPEIVVELDSENN